MYSSVAYFLVGSGVVLGILWFIGLLLLWGFLELYDNGKMLAVLNKDKEDPASLGDFLFVGIIGGVLIACGVSGIVAPFWPVMLPLVFFIGGVLVVKVRREMKKES